MLLSPDIATGTADVTSGAVDSDVRASGTRGHRVRVFGIGTHANVCVVVHACCAESPPPFSATKSGEALVQCPVKLRPKFI